MSSLSPSLAKAIPLATSEVEPSTQGGPGGVGQPVVLTAALRDVGVTVIVPCGSTRTSRPTLATPRTGGSSTFAIGWTRKTSSQLTAGVEVQLAPGLVIFQTRPSAVVPSETQRFPLLSKAIPLAPGTPEAKMVALGGVVLSGLKV